MKFQGDMGISPKSIEYLRRSHYEAVHLFELRLERLSDFDILMKAYREGYVILTNDLDFGDLLVAGTLELPSVVIFRLQNMRSANVNQYLDIILESHISDLAQGAVISISEKGVRVRRLPIMK